jgi:hypothetical protein
MLQLGTLNIHSIALTAHLIEQRLRLPDIQFTHESMLELVVDDLISMLQRINRGIENAKFGVSFAQAIVVDGHRSTHRQLDKVQIRGRGLCARVGRLHHATDLSPCIDFVVQRQWQEQVVEGGGGAGPRHIARTVLSLSRSRDGWVCTHGG